MPIKMFTIFSISILLGLRAQAIPLFGETAGTIKHGSLTLYRDSESKNKVYFFPNSTEFSKDMGGVPLFNFVYWSDGAYLTMTTHLSSDTNQKRSLQLYIAENPNNEVSVLPIKSSTIGLKSTKESTSALGNLFDEFTFSKVAGRAEDEIGINAVLTPTGAKVFKAMLLKSAGGSYLNLHYCYKIQGLGPNMVAEIRVDMRRIYDYFEARSSGGYFWSRYNIRSVTEKLKEEHAISIRMDGGDAKEWEVLERIAETITARLFKPELSSSSVSPTESGRLFNFGASHIHKEELKSEVWNWNRRDLEEREFCTGVALKDIEPYKNKLITNADE